MISGLDLGAIFDYTLKKDIDNPTIWKLGILPSSIIAQFGMESQKGNHIDLVFKLLQIGIKGWSNFKTPFITKKEIIFGQEIEAVPMEILNTIPLEAIMELSEKIFEINNLTKEEQKN